MDYTVTGARCHSTASALFCAENFDLFLFTALKSSEQNRRARANPPCITMGVCVLGGRKLGFEGSVATGGDAL